MQAFMNSKIDQIIRVNHAGEQGAVNIYKTQNKIAKNEQTKQHLSKSLAEETTHLSYFEQQIIARKIRPTALSPIWHLGACLIGGISAIMGDKAIMVATEAVEEVITAHYKEQIDDLKQNYPQETELLTTIEQFCQQEQNHKDEAIQMGSKDMIGYPIFYAIVKNLTKLAVNTAKKI